MGRNSPERGSGLRLSDGARIHLEAWRDLGGDPGQKAGNIGGHGQGQIGSDAAQLAAPAFVEDRNPRLEAGAVLGEGRTRHSTRKDQMRGLGQATEGLSADFKNTGQRLR